MWPERIAIVGIALRIPGAETPDELWEDMAAGRPRIHRFTQEELASAGLAEATYTAPDFVAASGVLPGVDLFDAAFFGMSAREAAVTDPQQRLLLETCYHALEDAGYPAQSRDLRIGVYASTGYRLYSLHSYLAANLEPTGWERGWMSDKQVQVGNYPDFAATRVAFRLGLTGPAINVATACSSSLVSVHLACQALLLGDVDLALVGSAALHLPQVTGFRYVKGSTISRSGVIRPFDAEADGTVGGNGVAAVLLKPLDRALADGDRVYAVIAGTGAGNDGATKPGFAAPSAAGQRAAVLSAFQAAGLPAESIGYLEAHGTGTFKGDPIEFEGLRSAFRHLTDATAFCALGTVKSRIGHLDSAAGLAGLISAVLTLRHGVIPPLVGFRRPNPALDLAGSPFTLSAGGHEWPVPGTRRAGVHSVGMGGTNAHLILEQADEVSPVRRGPVPGVLPLSARDPEALVATATAFRDHLRADPGMPLADLVTTAALGRVHFPHRVAVTGRSTEEMAAALTAYLSGSAAEQDAACDDETGALARSYRSGADVDWRSVLDGCGGRRISLPTYPFRRTRHWIGPAPVVGKEHIQHTGHEDRETDMSKPATLIRILELTARHLGVRPEEVDPERTFVDLGADSLQLVGVLVELEGEFGVDISMQELLEGAGTPHMAAELVTARQAGRPVAPVDKAVGPPPAAAGPVSEPASAVHGPMVTVAAGSGMAADAISDTQVEHLADLTRRLTRRTLGSKEITQRYRKVLADSRAAVGFRSATKEMRYPIASRAARGVRLEDVDGNSYVDITMGFGALLFGHEPEFVTEAVRAHLSHGLQFGARNSDAGEVATLLSDLTGVERVAFASSGTEANSGAIRLARAATGRSRIVMFRGSYHGHIDTVLGRPSGRGNLSTVPVSPGIPNSAVADVLVLEYGDPHGLEIIAEQANSIAAVLVEPVQCRNPSLRPMEFVRSLRELTSRHGIVLIFDEMLTGLRPHPRGAQHHYGVVADLTTYGKALGSGFPIGAIAGRADILDGVDGGFWRYGDGSGPTRETVFFGGTYMQHPVSMAAARAVLTHLKQEGPRLQESVNARTDALAQTLNGFFADEEFPLRMDHFGSMFRFTHRADMELLYHHLLVRDVYVWEWRSFYLSTAHTDADVEHVADAVRDSLRELRGAGYFPGTRSIPAPPPPRPAPDFGVYFFGDYPDDGGKDRYQQILDTARFADKHGFHSVWLPERHFHSFGGLFPNPAVLASALAVHTDRIRLNAGSVVLPLHDPIRVAEEWSMVDNLSGGRVGLGIGTGWHAGDFVLHPDRFDRRREVAFDNLTDVRRLWRGETLRRRSGSGEDVEVRIYPRPVQHQPPMWLATTGKPDSYEHAGRLDLGVLTNLMNQSIEQLADNIRRYRNARREAGLDPAAGRVTVLLHTYLGDDHTAARAEAMEPMVRYLRSSLFMRSAAAAGGVTSDELTTANPENLELLFRRAYDRYCDQRALIGTPESCTEVVNALRSAGVDEIAALVDFGMSAEQVATGLTRLDQLRQHYHPGRADTADEPGSEPEPAMQPAQQLAQQPTQQPAQQPAQRSGLATATQRRVWLASQLIGPCAYNEVQAVRLRGPLDKRALRAALHSLIRRHPGLRTVFRAGDSDHRLLQCVHDRMDIPIVETDHSGEDATAAIRAAVADQSRRAFDIARGPLCRAHLLTLGVDDHALLLGIHHLITDGTSARIIASDLAELYRAEIEGEAPQFSAPAASPLDASEEINRAEDLEWWRDQLREPPVLRLPTDRERAGAVVGTGGVVTGSLDRRRTALLRRWSGHQGVTMFATLITAWRVVLRRFSGQAEFLLGSTFGHRPDQAHDVVGMFASLLPMRATLRDDMDLRAAVRAARDLVLAATEHRQVDLDTLLAEVNPDPGAVRPLMPASIDLDGEPLSTVALPGLRAEPVDAGTESSPLELSLMVTESDTGLRLRIRYDAGLFDEATARRYLGQLELVLESIAADRANRIGDLPTLTRADERELREFGTGPRLTQTERTLTGPPVLSTVVDEGGRYDGQTLSKMSGALAARLAEAGVRRGDVVALGLPRGHVFAAAVLAACTVGAAYLPLDLGQPRPRLTTILSDAAPVVLVCDKDFEPAFAPGTRRVHVGDGDGFVTPVQVMADDLLCLFYTSGSTGKPKGVAIEHGNMAATLAVYRQLLTITKDDRLSWYSATGFDAVQLDLWPAFATGAELHVVPDHLRLAPEELVMWLARNEITIALLPTAVGEAVLDQPWPADAALRYLCVGGEKLNSRPSPDTPFTVINVYGPTECSVFCSAGPVSPHGANSPSIGVPNPGTLLEIRDHAGRPLPVGAAGELHVGGPQVARGYHADAQLTARRFALDGDGRRWYRTGDTVRWRNDGTCEYLGRADEQVQIRGVRVEPEEVARAVRSLPDVVDARVVPSTDRGTGRSMLTCHVLPVKGTNPVGLDDDERAQRWRAQLARLLPRPMVPERWHIVAELPLTTNGKWDHTGTAPDNGAVTSAVRQEWAGVLGGQSFGDDASFFDLGGHSILAITLLNRVRQRFGVAYPIAEFFAEPTVRTMASRLAANGHARVEPS
jgi:iturin family lipopeptide synthetase A